MNSPMNAIRTDELRFRTRELAARADRTAYLRTDAPARERRGLASFSWRPGSVPARSLPVSATAQIGR